MFFVPSVLSRASARLHEAAQNSAPEAIVMTKHRDGDHDLHRRCLRVNSCAIVIQSSGDSAVCAFETLAYGSKYFINQTKELGFLFVGVCHCFWCGDLAGGGCWNSSDSPMSKCCMSKNARSTRWRFFRLSAIKPRYIIMVQRSTWAQRRQTSAAGY